MAPGLTFLWDPMVGPGLIFVKPACLYSPFIRLAWTGLDWLPGLAWLPGLDFIRLPFISLASVDWIGYICRLETTRRFSRLSCPELKAQKMTA